MVQTRRRPPGCRIAGFRQRSSTCSARGSARPIRPARGEPCHPLRPLQSKPSTPRPSRSRSIPVAQSPYIVNVLGHAADAVPHISDSDPSALNIRIRASATCWANQNQPVAADAEMQTDTRRDKAAGRQRRLVEAIDVNIVVARPCILVNRMAHDSIFSRSGPTGLPLCARGPCSPGVIGGGCLLLFGQFVPRSATVPSRSVASWSSPSLADACRRGKPSYHGTPDAAPRRPVLGPFDRRPLRLGHRRPGCTGGRS